MKRIIKVHPDIFWLILQDVEGFTPNLNREKEDGKDYHASLKKNINGTDYEFFFISER